MPGGCKSSFIGKSPHISYITELFGPRVLFFEMGIFKLNRMMFSKRWMGLVNFIASKINGAR